MEFDLHKIVNQKRSTTSGYHLLVGRGWRIIGEQHKLHSPLAYSAFEFRCSIERALIELFVIIRGNQFSDADIQALQSISRVRKAIYQACGGKEKYDRSTIFNRLYTNSIGLPPNLWISIIDIPEMERNWSKLSEYCHKQLKPQSTWESLGDVWLLNGYELLNDVEKYLWSILVQSRIGWVHAQKIHSEERAAMNDFVNGKINQQELETRFRIMAPILRKRGKPS
jgi:hypothetical protein